MPPLERSTAIVRFFYQHHDEHGQVPLPLDRDRHYQTQLTIDGDVTPSLPFCSPLGDEGWRNAMAAMRRCSRVRVDAPLKDETRESAARRLHRQDVTLVRSAGFDLRQALAGLSPALRAFLERTTPRRLVIESLQSEIHALPWEAMVDEKFASLARHGLSIVRCQTSFNPRTAPGPEVLRVLSLRGPGVPDDAIASIRSVGWHAEATGDAGGAAGMSGVTGMTGMASMTGLTANGRGVIVSDRDEPPAQLVHLIAHGDPGDATTAVGGGDVLTPERLADRYRGRLMVLLWSCYSSKAGSTGVSPAMALQASGNAFVLAFTAPLDFQVAFKIASTFYEDVFGAAGRQDPEGAVTAIRARLFDSDYEFCDWASMTVWLQSPIDLSRVPLGQLRLPEHAWTSEGAPVTAVVPEPIQTAFDNAALGEAQIVESQAIQAPLSRHLVDVWSGPVVLLDGPDALQDEAVFSALGAKPDPDAHVHAADRFLLLLDRLATYPQALLIWISIGHEQVLLVHTLDTLPPNVGIILISPYALGASWPGRLPPLTGGSQEGERPIPTGRDGFLHLARRERYGEALRRLDASDPGMGSTEHLPSVEDLSTLYQAYVRKREADAPKIVTRLTALDVIEAHLLGGNLASRENDHRRARNEYQEAARLALAASPPRFRELARARQEAAFLADEMGDRGRAAQLYLSAIRLLQSIDAAERNSLWTSALARVHRDYAHLLATQGRAEEALLLLRRATAIHALEGRQTQIAYCFVSRSEALCRQQRYDDADIAAQEAAIVFERARNDNGWVDAVSLIARAASERALHAQAIAVLRDAACRPLSSSQLGRIFFQMAKVCWNAGRLEDAAYAARRAIDLLGTGPYRRQCAEALRLRDATAAVAPVSPRVAALAGRRLADVAFKDLKIDRMREALSRVFIDERIESLVSSAARGADLIGLEVAARLRIPRHIVLPFDQAKFRETSVGTDDRDRWSQLYENFIRDERRTGRLIELGDAPDEYHHANVEILAQARALSRLTRPLAIVVWEGTPNRPDDVTAAFREAAKSGEFDIRDVII